MISLQDILILDMCAGENLVSILITALLTHQGYEHYCRINDCCFVMCAGRNIREIWALVVSYYSKLREPIFTWYPADTLEGVSSFKAAMSNYWSFRNENSRDLNLEHKTNSPPGIQQCIIINHWDRVTHIWVGKPSLIQTMACRLGGEKPLSKPMLGYC